MRVRTSASTDARAGLALARAAQLPAGDARRLLAEARVLPLELDEEAARQLEVALAPHGVTVERVAVPPTTRRCRAHPRLTADHACASCRREVCVLCVPECVECAAVARRRAAWKRLRVAVLLVVLVALAFGGWRQSQRRARRVAWTRPVQVSVVLHSEAPLDDAVVARWTQGLEALTDWFAAEAQRHGAPLPRPVVFSLALPVRAGPRPLQPRPTGDWLDDAREGWAFAQQLEGLAAPGGDVRLVVALGAAVDDERAFVEGVADRGGVLGLVYASSQDATLGLELVAVAHEALHCLGAVDAYDAEGHAVVPRGLAEPEREPPYPQAFAEVMAGELPEGPGQGRAPKTLDEVRLGPDTAREIGWLRR